MRHTLVILVVLVVATVAAADVGVDNLCVAIPMPGGQVAKYVTVRADNTMVVLHKGCPKGKPWVLREKLPKEPGPPKMKDIREGKTK